MVGFIVFTQVGSRVIECLHCYSPLMVLEWCQSRSLVYLTVRLSRHSRELFGIPEELSSLGSDRDFHLGSSRSGRSQQ